MKTTDVQPGPLLSFTVEELSDRVHRKIREVAGLEQQVRDARYELQAAQDALRQAEARSRA